MTPEVNRNGLNRYIPEPVRRQIRRECGFGCVCCGLAIATYEHIDPPFKDAYEHDPSKMAFLCGGCHDRVTRRVWSKQKILDARRNPRCVVNGKCHDSFDISVKDPVLWVGPNRISGMRKIFSVDDDILLSIEPPDNPGEPYLISGRFFDSSGNLLFEINRNEWIGKIENWDIETIGPTIIIRTAPSTISLRITVLPPSGIAIERADMFFKHARFIVNKYEAQLLSWSGGGIRIQGREIKGTDYRATLLVAHRDGTCSLGGGEGEFSILPPPKRYPGTIRKRMPIGRNSKCVCGSGLKFKNCCGQEKTGN